MKTKHPVDEWRAVLRQELEYIERNPCKAKPISCEPAQLKRLLDDADRAEELEGELFEAERDVEFWKRASDPTVNIFA